MSLRSKSDDQPRTLAVDGFYTGVTDDGEMDIIFFQYRDPIKNLKDEARLGTFRVSKTVAKELAKAINTPPKS